MMKLTYNGVDITSAVSVRKCYHDMYAAGKSDTLNLRLNDASSLWDVWSPQAGDEIKVDYGNISTGTMFVTSTTPRNGEYAILAMSAPSSGFVPQNKAWQSIRLLQLGREIAERNGLAFDSYGVTDNLYSYVMQQNEGDLPFLHRLATQEGCAFIVYNKRLVMYSEAYMEAVPPSEVLSITNDVDYEYTDRSAAAYGSCVVSNGQYSGNFVADSQNSRVYQTQNVIGTGSAADAERFAKGLLRAANKDCRSGYVRTPILSGYAAASTVELRSARAPSWDGAVFLDHIRNDYVTERAKVWFRKPLEGY